MNTLICVDDLDWKHVGPCQHLALDCVAKGAWWPFDPLTGSHHLSFVSGTSKAFPWDGPVQAWGLLEPLPSGGTFCRKWCPWSPCLAGNQSGYAQEHRSCQLCRNSAAFFTSLSITNLYTNQINILLQYYQNSLSNILSWKLRCSWTLIASTCSLWFNAVGMFSTGCIQLHTACANVGGQQDILYKMIYNYMTPLCLY